MLNTEDFIARLEKLMDFYGLSASIFADKIGVQRSGISHLLSGRNKPSLDFVLKIHEEFPDVDLYWLLNGNGNLLKKDTAPISSEMIESKKSDEVTEPIPTSKNTAKEFSIQSAEKEIYKIVFFYKDGSFKDFYPNT